MQPCNLLIALSRSIATKATLPATWPWYAEQCQLPVLLPNESPFRIILLLQLQQWVSLRQGLCC